MTNSCNPTGAIIKQTPATSNTQPIQFLISTPLGMYANVEAKRWAYMLRYIYILHVQRLTIIVI